MPSSVAFLFIVLSLVVVDHAIEVGRCRGSRHFENAPIEVGRQRRFGV
jgi:hypothetical protein